MAFVYEEVVKSFRKAMKGLGTDEKRIIKEVCSYDIAQRQEIKAEYMLMYGKTLEEDLKSEISGHFLKGVLGLLMPTEEYEATCLRNAMKGLGTNEKVMIELLCSKDANEIKKMAQVFKRCKLTFLVIKKKIVLVINRVVNDFHFLDFGKVESFFIRRPLIESRVGGL